MKRCKEDNDTTAGKAPRLAAGAEGAEGGEGKGAEGGGAEGGGAEGGGASTCRAFLGMAGLEGESKEEVMRWLSSWQPEAADLKNGVVLEIIEQYGDGEVMKILVKVVMKLLRTKCEYTWQLRDRFRKLFQRTRAVMTKCGESLADQWTFLAKLQEGGSMYDASLYEQKDPVLDLAARLTTLASTSPLSCARHGCKELGMLKVCQVIKVLV